MYGRLQVFNTAGISLSFHIWKLRSFPLDPSVTDHIHLNLKTFCIFRRHVMSFLMFSQQSPTPVCCFVCREGLVWLVDLICLFGWNFALLTPAEDKNSSWIVPAAISKDPILRMLELGWVSLERCIIEQGHVLFHTYCFCFYRVWVMSCCFAWRAQNCWCRLLLPLGHQRRKRRRWKRWNLAAKSPYVFRVQ